VDIGGRRIQIDCLGVGKPVVVFEAGLDLNGALSWSSVHRRVAELTRACAYSRAGILWSEPRPGRTSSIGIAEELHRLLNNAGEKPPYVMVGHSLGGLYVVTYTNQFPAEVAGVVLVEAAHPEQGRPFRSVVPTLSNRTPPAYRLKVRLAWTGIMRADRDSSSGVPHQSLRDIQVAAAYAPTSLAALLQEEDAMEETLATAAASHNLGDRPTFVLTAAGPLVPSTIAALQLDVGQAAQLQNIWKQLQDEEATWSSRSQHEVIPDTGHYLQFDRPDAVIAAVNAVVERVRALQRGESSLPR
jgi:pimeloyl-ACP methyl ester carboxylesterase